MIHISISKKLWSQDGTMVLNIDLDIPKGSLYSIFGQSGAGKTSLLRMIAGLMRPDRGVISVDGKIWFDSVKKINLKPQQRKVGLLFQDYALFPNMTVEENIKFALKSDESIELVKAMMDKMELSEFSQRKTEVLSGGQKQRVALARSLIHRPDVLLLDEPLSALDNRMRNKLQELIEQVHTSMNLTTLMISHDVPEIIRLSDTIVHLEEGRIIRSGSPIEVFTGHQVRGKFKLIGEVIDIFQEDFVFIVTVLIGKNLIRVIVDETRAQELSHGDEVLIASEAFNPLILKIL